MSTQYDLANQFGYVESLGGDGLKRGDLVPYDHPTSPLTTEEIETLMKARNTPGVIGNAEVKKKPVKRAVTNTPSVEVHKRSAHRCWVCEKCGVSIRAGSKFEKHYAKCQPVRQAKKRAPVTETAAVLSV